MQRLNLVGQRFGKLIVFEEAGRSDDGHVKWKCRCDCGNVTTVIGSLLVKGATKSCGCLKGSHMATGSRLYRIWKGMRRRCNHAKTHGYKYYGGKGIQVCAEWECSFISFQKWAMENGYSDDLTIDRIDGDKNYSPNNCRWATYREQFRNMRRTIKINGISLYEHCQRNNLSYPAMRKRINNGWSFEEAFNTPYRNGKMPDKSLFGPNANG